MLMTLLLATAGWTLAGTVPATAAEPPVFQRNGLAIGGYDPVAYFTEGKPVRGKAAHSFRWNGATWRFASAAHLARFRAEPVKYAPRYGGYCAYAVARNYTAKTEPDAWTIHDGKLYLNYNRLIRAAWERNKARDIARADRNWPAVLGR